MIPTLLCPRRSLATFWVNTIGEQVRSMGVPEIMEPQTRQGRPGNQPGPLLRNIDRLNGRAVGVSNNKVVVR